MKINKIFKNRFRVSVILCLFLSSFAEGSWDPVGAVAGGFEVSADGQAGWTLPIEAPPGINGLFPKIELKYSASGGEGIAGVGGSLSGFSAIYRCAGHGGKIRYDKTDNYCMNGARLMLIKGEQGMMGSEYRTEEETFQKISVLTANSLGPSAFLVQTNAGGRMYFGGEPHAGSLDMPSGAHMEWRIRELQDRHSNYISYVYSDEYGSLGLPLSVSYGGNKVAAQNHFIRVNFQYEDRADEMEGFHRGQLRAFSKRLHKIVTSVHGELAREYRIGYEEGEISGATKIRRVWECDNSSNCYRPTEFLRTPESLAWSSTSHQFPKLQREDGAPKGVVIDLNNDGWDDIILASKDENGANELSTYQNSESGLLRNHGLQLPGVLYDFSSGGLRSVGTLMDVDRDGWVDFLQYIDSSQSLWLNQNGKFVASGGTNIGNILEDLVSEEKTGEWADVNGDGWLDLLVSAKFDDGRERKGVWLRRGTSWEKSDTFVPPSYFADFRSKTYGKAHISDINADGFPDWVLDTGEVWLNTGTHWEKDGRYGLPVPLTISSNEGKRQPNAFIDDINGDGLKDLFQAYEENHAAWLNTGIGWRRDGGYDLPSDFVSYNDQGDVQNRGAFLDLNADGKPEYIIAYKDASGVTKQIWSHTRNGWAENGSLDFPAPLFMHRLDGASVDHLISLDSNADTLSEMVVIREGQNAEMFHPQGLKDGKIPGGLYEIRDGLGNSTLVDYGLSTYTLSDGNKFYELAEQEPFPSVANNSPKLLVRYVRSSSGQNEWAGAYHRYGGARVDLDGRGNLGFAWHSVEDDRSGIEIKSYYRQEFPGIGSVIESNKIYRGNLIGQTQKFITPIDKDWDSDGKVDTRFALDEVVATKVWNDAGGLLITETVTTKASRNLDTYGNVKEVVVESRAPSRGNEWSRKTTKRSYRNLADAWLLGMVERTEVLNEVSWGALPITNVSVSRYSDKGDLEYEMLEPDYAGADAHTIQLTKRYEYDVYGNQISSTTASDGMVRRSRVEYSSDGRFPEKTYNPKGHMVTTQFSPLHGKPVSVVDPNGVETVRSYDGFGKVTRESKVHQSTNAEYGREVAIPRWCEGQYAPYCPEHATFFIGSINDRNEAPEYVYFDSFGREVRKKTHAFDDVTDQVKFVVFDTHYDSFGRKEKVSEPYFEGLETPKFTVTKYDHMGRVIETVAPSGAVRLTKHDLTDEGYSSFATKITVEGESTQHHVRQNSVSVVETNILGKPVLSINALGTGDESRVEYFYDSKGALLKTRDDHHNEIINTYDRLGRKIKMDDPDMGVWEYEYNAFGELVKQWDAKAQERVNGSARAAGEAPSVEMQYDALGRVVGRAEAEGQTNWIYDEGTAGVGRLARVVSPTYSRSHTYDSFGRAAEISTTVGEEVFVQKIGYQGNNDKVDWVEYPSKLIVNKTYDAYGYPKTIQSIDVDSSKYTAYQEAYKKYLDAVKAFEEWKKQLHDENTLDKLDVLEGQLRQYEARMRRFYEMLALDPDYLNHEDNAKYWQDLISEVDKKLTQHNNWSNIYRAKYQPLSDAYRAAGKKIKIYEKQYNPKKLETEFKTAEKKFDSTKQKYEARLSDAKPYRDRAWQAWNGEIKHRISEVRKQETNIKNNINAIKDAVSSAFKSQHRKAVINYLQLNAAAGSGSTNNPNKGKEGKCPSDDDDGVKEERAPNIGGGWFVSKSKIKWFSQKVKYHSGQSKASLDKITKLCPGLMKYVRGMNDDIKKAQNIENDAKDKYEDKLKVYAGQMQSIGKKISEYNKKVDPHVKVIEANEKPLLMYGHLVSSHSNVITGYNDRLTAYAKNISKETGSYFSRKDLHPRYFFDKPFKFLEYAACKIQNKSNKCQTVLIDDNLLGKGADEVKRETGIDINQTDYEIDVAGEWKLRRFMCPDVHGYNCPDEFSDAIKLILKAVWCQQDAKGCTVEAEGPEDAKVFKGVKVLNTLALLTDAKDMLWNGHAANVVTKVCAASITHCEASADDVWEDPDKPTPFSSLLYTHSVHSGVTGQQSSRLASGSVGSLDLSSRLTSVNQYLSDVLDSAKIKFEPKEDEEESNNDYVLIAKGGMQQVADTYRNASKRGKDCYPWVENLPKTNQDDCYSIAEQGVKDEEQAILALLFQGGSNSADTSVEDIVAQGKALRAKVESLEEALQTAYSEAVLASKDNENYKVYWRALEIAADGQAKKVKYGNDVVTDWVFSHGRAVSIQAKNGGQTLLNHGYYFDNVGNLVQRQDYIAQFDERFYYDGMNRLVKSEYDGAGAKNYQFVGMASNSFAYDSLGNMVFKEDVGDYSYGQRGLVDPSGFAGPHAVTRTVLDGVVTHYRYDANGNQLSGGDRVVEWSSFNKPVRVATDAGVTTMSYGPERQLLTQKETADGSETTYISSGFEKVRKDGKVRYRHHLSVGGTAVAVIETSAERASLEAYYLHQDHQDSVVAITDQNGQVIQRNHYDAFGKQLTAVTVESQPFAAAGLSLAPTTRGYTGHRHMNSLIHMNGRMYDPVLARFISADPYIQSPLNSQSLNRYSYVWNNPLSFVDPSGYILKWLKKFLKKLVKAIKKLVKNVLRLVVKVVRQVTRFVKKYWRVIVAVAIMAIVPQAAGAWLQNIAASATSSTVAFYAAEIALIGGAAIAGALSGLVATGSLKGMFIGAITAAAFAGIGMHYQNTKLINSAKLTAGSSIKIFADGLTFGQYLGRAVAHGVVGGLKSVAMGGKFKHGFSGAFFGKLATPAITFHSSYARIVAAGVVGGAASVLAGGEFNHGFWPAAFGVAFNELAAGQRGGYDSTDENFHEYKYSSKICSTSSAACTPENVWDSVKNNSVPFQDGPLTDGARNTIPGIGEVETFVDDANYTLVNQTTPGHLFHDGTVTRSLTITQDAIYVNTHGVGVNTSSITWGLNHAGGLYFPVVLDNNIRWDIWRQ